MSRFHTILKHTFKIALKVFPRAVNLTFVTYCLCKLSTSVCHTFNVLFMTGLIYKSIKKTFHLDGFNSFFYLLS